MKKIDLTPLVEQAERIEAEDAAADRADRMASYLGNPSSPYYGASPQEAADAIRRRIKIHERRMEDINEEIESLRREESRRRDLLLSLYHDLDAFDEEA